MGLHCSHIHLGKNLDVSVAGTLQAAWLENVPYNVSSLRLVCTFHYLIKVFAAALETKGVRCEEEEANGTTKTHNKVPGCTG